MGWSEKYKKSIDCDNPKGFSQRAHCQGKKKKMNEDLRKWFGKGKEGGVGGGGWDRYNAKGERIGKCAREPGEPKPKCLSKEKAAKMSKDERAAAVRRKREKDPVADRPGKGGSPKMVSNRIGEEFLYEKNVPTNPSLWSRAKSLARSKFDVYPSAYANGWAAKWYKKRGGGWKSSKSNNEQFSDWRKDLEVEKISEEKSQDHEYSMARSELSTIVSAAKRLRKKMKGEGQIKAWVQSKITKASDYLDTAADYVDSGEVKEHVENIHINPMFNITNKFSDWRSELELDEAIDKSKMKCNKPKAQAVGDSLTGKSHVVKACEGGKEKIIRFGQRGVKGSPKKEGESEEYASRRKAFRARHAKNIAKGKMSAAYWSNVTKW
jgi:predicted transposase YbfD/YdcC